jgi:hypothetical protein
MAKQAIPGAPPEITFITQTWVAKPTPDHSGLQDGRADPAILELVPNADRRWAPPGICRKAATT